MDGDRLDEIVKAQFSETGIEAKASFQPFPELKVRWQRNNRVSWIDFEISDYLTDAPESVIKDVLDVIIFRIKGEESNYSDETFDYFNSKEFCDKYQDTFITRNKGLIFSDNDRLYRLHRELVDEGLLSDSDVRLVWGEIKNAMKYSCTMSLMFKTVIVPTKIKDIPDGDMKAVIYAGSSFVNQPYGSIKPISAGKYILKYIDSHPDDLSDDIKNAFEYRYG